MSKPRSVGTVRLSKSRKGVIVKFGDQMWFTSVKSVRKVLDGAIPYTVLREAKQGEGSEQTEKPSTSRIVSIKFKEPLLFLSPRLKDVVFPDPEKAVDKVYETLKEDETTLDVITPWIEDYVASHNIKLSPEASSKLQFLKQRMAKVSKKEENQP